jgi:hypothetical protein
VKHFSAKSLIGPALQTVLVASLLLTAACTRGRKVMTPVDNAQSGAPTQTKVSLESGEMVITSSDVQEIKRALEEYLKNSKDEIAKNLPQNLIRELPEKVGEAWIDQGGMVRISPWLLEARGDKLVLTYRAVPPTTGFGYQFNALLQRPNQQWMIASITYAKLYPRR